MSEKQLLLMFILFLCALVRPFVMRRCAVTLDAKVAPTFISFWILIACALIYPFFSEMLHTGLPIIQERPVLLLIGLAKGVSLWGIVVVGQKMLAVSSSSNAYRAPLAIGLIAIGAYFQGEVLNTAQWFAVGALFFLGIIFMKKGHISTLPKGYRRMFVFSILLAVLPAMCDQAVIPHTNWYTQLFLSGIAMFACSAVLCRSPKVLFKQVASSKAMIAGPIWALSEVVILMIIVTHVPVTMAILAMTMTVPTMMVVSSLMWKEGNWIQQGAFGVAAYAATIPMIIT